MTAYIKVNKNGNYIWKPTGLSIEESIRQYAMLQPLKIEWKNEDGSFEEIII